MKKTLIVLSAAFALCCTALFTACGQSHKHTYASEWSCDETNHYHAATCEHTDLKRGEAPHSFGEWETVGSADGVITTRRFCSICEYAETKTQAEHTHTFAENWSYDETNHYRAATCEHTNEKTDIAAHDFDDGAETSDGIKYTCKVCGYSKLQTFGYTVTAEEFASILCGIEKFKADCTFDSSRLVIAMANDAVRIDYPWGESICFSCEGENYFRYSKAEEEYWVKDPTTKDEYDYEKSSNNAFLLLKDCFSAFSYDAATKSYKAESLTIGDGDGAMTFKNLSFAFKGGKLISAAFTRVLISYDETEDYVYTYSEIGTASVDLPSDIHEHTYSDEWSSNMYYHYHAATCGHNEKKDYEEHTYVNGICSVCGANALILSNDGKTVIGIADKNLTSVTFPQGVTAIGDDAFWTHPKLTEIEIPEGVKTIGNNAFSGCSELAKATLPEGLTTIGSGAFSDCPKLTEIEIPEGVTAINFNTFKNCSALKKVSFAEGLLIIDNYAFEGCSALSDIALPSGLTRIGTSAFKNCDLTRVIVPDTVTEIGGDVFACPSLTFLKMSGGIESIKSTVFGDYTSLKIAVVSEGTTNLYLNSFGGCTALEKVVLPKSLTSIYANVFKNSDKLEAICYSGTRSDWEAVVIQANTDDKINVTPIYFYSETEPTESGKFWHYVDGEVTIWHKHTFAEEWSHNETHHWHASSCGHADAVSEYAEHEFSESAETEEGTVYACSCGYSETRVSRYRVSAESFANLLNNATSFRCSDSVSVYDCNDPDWKVRYSNGTIKYYSSDNTTYYTYYLDEDSGNWIKQEITRSEYFVAARLNLFPYIAELFNELTYDVNQKYYKGTKVLAGGNELTELYCYFKDGKLDRVEFVTQGILFTYTEFDNITVELPEIARAQ